jgi:hypothetical protein
LDKAEEFGRKGKLDLSVRLSWDEIARNICVVYGK